MKKQIFSILVLLLLLQGPGYAVDFKAWQDKLNMFEVSEALKTAGLDIDNVSRYLNWETINLSFRADLTNITDSMGRKATVEARVFKKGLSGIRVEMKGEIRILLKESAIKLNNFYMLCYPLKEKSYLVYPLKKAYMKLDPEKGREMLGQLKEKMDDKSSEIEKKEILGTEEIEGYICDRVHVVMTLENGTRCDINAWLAKKLKNFPLKTVLRYETLRGITGTNTSEFKNMEKTELKAELFDIPGGFTKCNSIIELATGGKFGSRMKKRKGKLFKR